MSLQHLLSGDVVRVTPYAGESARGPVYGPPVDVDCRVEAKRQLVRNGDGDEVVSEATVYALAVLPDGTAAGQVFTAESLVTVSGRSTQVLTVQEHRGTGAAVLVEVTVR